MRGLGVLASLVAILLTVACGSSNSPSTPISPTPPPTTPPTTVASLTGLILSAVPFSLVIGSSVQLRAVARFSDGAIQVVQPTWSVTPALAEITPAGLLVGRAAGNLTIVAQYQSASASTSLFVVRDFSGTWRGGWRRVECFGPRCLEGDSANPEVELLIAQHAGTGSNISGVMSFGPWTATRYVLSGSGSVGISPSANFFFSWLDRAADGGRQREIDLPLDSITIDSGQTLSARGSMRLREGEELTRLEFVLENLRLVSRAVRYQPTVH